MVCLYINAWSIINKFDEFLATINCYHPDIVGIVESWTTNEILDSELIVPGYLLFRQDRPTNRHGGGVLLYVKECLKPIQISVTSQFPEHVWCKIKGNKKDELYAGFSYRIDNVGIFKEDNNQQLRDLLDEMSKNRIMLMGDFNYKNIAWSKSRGMATESASLATKLFVDCLQTNFLTQHTLSPTRENNILDLVITSEPDLVDSVEVINPLANSDHCMLLYDVNMKASTMLV